MTAAFRTTSADEAVNGSPPARGIELRQLTPYYGDKQVVEPFDLHIEPNKITAFMGPSGCGKSTVLRCINRLHETVLGARADGDILLDGESIYGENVNPTIVRRKIGMVFQQPNPLWTRSIYENVAVGVRMQGIRERAELDEIVEKSLRLTALWDEVKDKLHQSGTALSGGQQQRLCIARTLAIEPMVLLLDEPCSALDPIATFKIEQLLMELKATYTIVIVTHNMQQAARVSDNSTVFLAQEKEAGVIGELVEYGPTKKLFTKPNDPRTEQYVTGRMG